MQKTFDFRGPGTYVDAVDWVRSNVILKNNVKGSVLEMEVLLPGGTVHLFMDSANHYIMGFRGADKIYILQDVNSTAFEAAVKTNYKDAKTEILAGLSVSHGAAGLGTFVNRKEFEKRELTDAVRISRYSSKGTHTFETLKRPLSLLIFMISESARMPMLQRDFKNMYLERDYSVSVFVDDAVQAYDKAKFLIGMGAKCFPQYPPALAVEKLEKRVAELKPLLAKIAETSKVANRQAMINDILQKRPLPSELAVKQHVERVRDMCSELQISDAAELTKVIAVSENSNAVRAAKEGVAIPPIGL